ncbi:MAG: hypothetical protein K0U74_09470 [Alphaproteobacteria bacterium]|nr:hypothetical protein [Alphaproteobacteria bacterium]
MPAPIKRINSPASAKAAIDTVRTWEADKSVSVGCPLCGADGLGIIDKSARPHMSWYALKCGACDLDEAIAIPESAHNAAID